MADPAAALDEGPGGEVGENSNARGMSGECGREVNEDCANDGARRSPVVMTWAGPEDEIVICGSCRSSGHSL